MKTIKRFFNSLFLRVNSIAQKLYFTFLPINNAINAEPRNFNIVVSLTSFPKRLPTLFMCIKTLMSQSLKPDKIILYLGTDTKKVPSSLKRLQKKGLTIKTEYEDLRPHKKYLFAAKEFPDSFIITVDDDLLYDKNMILDLWQTHLKYSDSVCARRVHLMQQKSGNILPYNKWLQEYGKQLLPTHSLFSTNGAGTLFPPNCLPQIAFDTNLIKKLCLNADDIWLKFMLIIANHTVVWTGTYAYMPKEIWIPSHQKGALMDQNVTKNQNDLYIEALQKHFNINLADFC